MKITRTRIEVLKDAFEGLRFWKNDWYVDLVLTSPRRSNELEFGVNWWATGTQSPAAARKFKNYLGKTISLAEYLNQLELEVVDEEDNLITDGDKYEMYKEVLMDCIYDRPYGDIEKTVMEYLGAEGEEDDRGYVLDDEENLRMGIDYSPSAPWNAPGMSISDFI